jgi:hypothetical protein
MNRFTLFLFNVLNPNLPCPEAVADEEIPKNSPDNHQDYPDSDGHFEVVTAS